MREATVTDGVAVHVGADGQLGTVLSSARCKESVHDLEGESEGLLRLRPVAFRYRAPGDSSQHARIGDLERRLAALEVDTGVATPRHAAAR